MSFLDDIPKTSLSRKCVAPSRFLFQHFKIKIVEIFHEKKSCDGFLGQINLNTLGVFSTQTNLKVFTCILQNILAVHDLEPVQKRNHKKMQKLQENDFFS